MAEPEGNVAVKAIDPGNLFGGPSYLPITVATATCSHGYGTDIQELQGRGGKAGAMAAQARRVAKARSSRSATNSRMSSRSLDSSVAGECCNATSRRKAVPNLASGGMMDGPCKNQRVSTMIESCGSGK